jgi:prolyl oligopeptidase
MDAVNMVVLGDTLENIKFSGLSWRGNEGFYYSSYGAPSEGSSELSAMNEQHKVYFHKLGTAQSEDELIFGGPDQPNRYLSASVTEDNRYLIISASQNTSGNRLYIKDLQDPMGDFTLIQEDYFKRVRVVHNVGNLFFLYTNIDAPNYRLVKMSLSTPGTWTDVIPESENVLSVGTGGGKLFASYLIDAKTEVYQYTMDGKEEWKIDLPGIGTAVGFNARNDEETLYYTFTSFTYPSTIFKYDIASGQSEVYQQPQVDFNPKEYETKQVFFTSKDGTEIPMFIVHKKGIELDGTNPTYLYGYGGFNVSLRPGFSPSRILWLENNGIYAVVNLRGGGEYGEEWHQAGTKMNKQNVFDDFISAAEHLINEKYTSKDYLAIAGGSNGGLLVGATMTQRPDLMKVALPAVGVLDMLRYHKFTAGAGWAADYGTSEDSPEMFEYLKGYSPYHALKPGTAYPATLVTTADHDDRVVPAHSFKFAARLQEYHAGETPVMIRVQTDAGHGSVSLEQSMNVTVDQFAFAWYNMGVIPEVAMEEM